MLIVTHPNTMSCKTEIKCPDGILSIDAGGAGRYFVIKMGNDLGNIKYDRIGEVTESTDSSNIVPMLYTWDGKYDLNSHRENDSE